MERFREILLAVWREACQHIDVRQSAAGIAELLATHLPLERLAVERINAEHRQLATVAVAPGIGGLDGTGVKECTATELKRLLAWTRRGEVAVRPAGDLPAAVSAAFPTDGSRDARVAPLCLRKEPVGALVVTAIAGERFTEKHDAMIAALQEPFAVALENDRRLHELKALREAAEADRRALLSRLGRQDINEQIIGEHEGLAPVMKRVDLVSGSDAPVLLLGETGTGKEVIARAIHVRSDRHDGPFIRVNCGAFPAELIDSQLFGHERGAFTGANETRKGWFERADGGTLFLDEIGELPLEAQVRFLRVLQDSFIERVGGHEPIRVDVRVVAATHRDLSAMVRDGKFREDLWYRIAVFPILLPPLRERLGDIPALAEHFAQRAAIRFTLPPAMPTAEDIEILRGYAWPGNIRELGAVIDRAAILGEGRSLEIVTALGFSADSPTAPGRAAGGTPSALDRPTANGEFGTLDDAISRHITAALRRARGRIEGPRGAAAALKVNPHTLRAKMRKLKIDWAQFRDP